MATVNCVPVGYGGTVTASAAGNEVTVDLTPALPDQSCCTVSISGVAGSENVATLDGDITRDKVVNTIDASAPKSQYGKGCGAPGYGPALDVNQDGVINTIDSSYPKSKFGRSTPPCP